MPSHPGTPYWQTHMPSHSATPNWQTPLPSHPHDVGLFNMADSIYGFASYYGLPKKQGDKTKNKAKNANVSPLNLGNSFVDDNVRDDDVMFMGERETDNYFVHENVDPSKVYITKLCAGEEPIVHGDSQTFWENIRYQMLLMFYQCRYEDTRNCGYD
ncbi:hypothetical protein Tco_0388826 [Tanacetum coccineum]